MKDLYMTMHSLLKKLFCPKFQPLNRAIEYFIDPTNSQEIRDWFQVHPSSGILSLQQDMRKYNNSSPRFTVDVSYMSYKSR